VNNLNEIKECFHEDNLKDHPVTVVAFLKHALIYSKHNPNISDDHCRGSFILDQGLAEKYISDIFGVITYLELTRFKSIIILIDEALVTDAKTKQDCAALNSQEYCIVMEPIDLIMSQLRHVI
jgi:hypothetical protein